MGNMVHSLLRVMQDICHQLYYYSLNPKPYCSLIPKP